MTYILYGLAAAVVLRIYYLVLDVRSRVDIVAKALNAHLRTGKDYREDISVAEDHGLVRYVCGQLDGHIEQLPMSRRVWVASAKPRTSSTAITAAQINDLSFSTNNFRISGEDAFAVENGQVKLNPALIGTATIGTVAGSAAGAAIGSAFKKPDNGGAE